MTPSEQIRKAKTLLDLHSGDRVLVLPNVWNPIGARVLAQKGYPAVATASAAISSSLGFLDGERITRGTMLEIVSGICRAVDVPVTADMEAGYAGSLVELDETTHGLLDAGAVGLNLEDGIVEGGALRPAAEQADRIARVRETAATRGIHLVINARIDSFLSEHVPGREEKIEDVVRRAAVYTKAGADCIYPIGPGDEDTLKQLRARIPAPLNALATENAVSLPGMAAIGINRVSFGPFLFRSCLRKFADIADALVGGGSYDRCFGETLSRQEAAFYLTSDKEDG